MVAEEGFIDKKRYMTGDKIFNKDLEMEIHQRFQGGEREKKQEDRNRQNKFANYLIPILYMFSICLNLHFISYGYRQDLKEDFFKIYLILNSVSLGFNIAFFFLHIIKKK